MKALLWVSKFVKCEVRGQVESEVAVSLWTVARKWKKVDTVHKVNYPL